MGIIEARAVISATDKTGGVFEKIAGKFKEIAGAAKSLSSVKPMAAWGSSFQRDLDRIKVSGRDIDTVRRSWESFNAALKSGGRNMKASTYFGAISQWKTQTLSDLRAVRAAMEDTERVQRRMSHGWRGGARLAAGALGVGSAAYVANRAGRGVVSAGSESVREGARDYLAGLSDAESDRIKRRSSDLSNKYPSITASTMHERLRDTAMSMRSLDKAFEVDDAIARGTVVLQSLKGKDQAVEEGRKFFRGLDVLGKNQDPKQVSSLFNGYIKALGVEGADLNLGDVFQVAKQSRSAGLALSDRFLMSVVPGLIGDMGAPQVGTALSSGLSQTIGGRATQKSKDEQARFGLRDAKGNFKDAALYQSDLDQYVYKKLIPALQAKGINADDATGVTGAISKLFSNKVVADILGKLVLQRDQYQAKGRQYDKAPGLSAADVLPGRDPFVAAEGFIAQLKNAASALAEPVFPLATSALNGLSSALGGFANRFSGADTAGKIGMGAGAAAIGGGAVAGGVAIGKGLYSWFTSGSALTASAAALNSSAAALTAAAAQLATGNAASKVAGPAAAAAGAGGGIFSRIAGGAVAAVPFVPAALAALAPIAGIAAYRAAKEEAGLDGLTGAQAAAKASGGSRLDHLRKSFNDDRERFGLPAVGSGEKTVKAEVEGNATITGQITVAPSPYFMTTIEAKIDSKINAFKASGITGQGSTGSTGRSSPDASPAP